MTHPIKLIKVLCTAALFLPSIGCSDNGSNPMSPSANSSIAGKGVPKKSTASQPLLPRKRTIPYRNTLSTASSRPFPAPPSWPLPWKEKTAKTSTKWK